jgi:hypothetical protein
MGVRAVLLCLISIAFLATSSLGLHSHEDEDTDHESATAATLLPASHSGHHVYLASELGEAHLAEHLLHGDVDVETKVFLFLKSTLSTLIVSLTILWFCVIREPGTAIRVARSDERPLRPPRRTRWFPPSQAPPCAA